MKKINMLLSVILFVGCGGGSDFEKDTTFTDSIDLTKDFKDIPEYQRLWYFGALNMGDSRDELGEYKGEGVKIVIMGEEVDASHPEIKNSIQNQYNTFAQMGKILKGKNNQPYGFEKLTYGDGHGTHIAGTIASACDGKGIVGIACGAEVDIYDLGVYGNIEKFSPKGWTHPDSFETILMVGFANALDHVTENKTSKIITGSFNLESPYFSLKDGGEIENLTLYEISQKLKTEINSVDDFMQSSLFEFKNPNDKEEIKSILSNIEDDEKLDTINGILMPKSKEWKQLEESIHRYQESGGVYIITESNNIFHKTSVLNAMPTISDKVDKDLWISAVLISPKGIDDFQTLQERKEAIKNSEWENIINDCGKTAQEYCVLIPSYDVLSTMTPKVRETEAQMFTIDGYNGYQVNTGHSMGAPMIAGALALMEEKNQKEGLGYSMKELVKILKQSANRKFKGYNKNRHGQGILDIKSALNAM